MTFGSPNKTVKILYAFLFSCVSFLLGFIQSDICLATEQQTIINIIQPESGILVSSKSISVVGRVADSVVLKSLVINHEEFSIPSVPGFSFNIEVDLQRGKNDITIVATDEDGTTQMETLNVTRDDVPPEIDVKVSTITDVDGQRMSKVEAVITEEFTRLSSILFDGEVVDIPTESKVFFVTKKVPVEREAISIRGGDAAGNDVVWDVNMHTGETVARAPKLPEEPFAWEAPAIPPVVVRESMVEKPPPQKPQPKRPVEQPRKVDVSLNGDDFYSIALLRPEEGRTYITVRNLAEVLPFARLEMEEDTIQVVSGKGQKIDEITLKSGETDMLVNGEEIATSFPVSISDDHYGLPLRKIFQALGYDVEWLHGRKKVVLSREEEVEVVEEVASIESDEYEWPPVMLDEEILEEEPKKSPEDQKALGKTAQILSLMKSGIVAKLIILIAFILMVALTIKIVPYVTSSNITREARQKQREKLRAKRLHSRIKTLTREIYTADKLSAKGETELLAIFNKIQEKINISKREQDEVFNHFFKIIKRVMDEDAYINSRISVSAVEDRSFKGLLVSRFTLNGILRRRETFSQDYLWFTSGGKWVCRQRIADGKQVEIEYARGVKPWDE